MPNDALAALAALVQDQLPDREPGWYTMKELMKASPRVNESTMRGRVERALNDGKMECKKALVPTTAGKRECNVYRIKP